jgi:hypothetical protein
LRHVATADFWVLIEQLPLHVKELATKNFQLLKADPRHPSLHLKKIGNLWSARVGMRHRVLGLDKGDTILRFWIGAHSDYDKLDRD